MFHLSLNEFDESNIANFKQLFMSMMVGIQYDSHNISSMITNQYLYQHQFNLPHKVIIRLFFSLFECLFLCVCTGVGRFCGMMY